MTGRNSLVAALAVAALSLGTLSTHASEPPGGDKVPQGRQEIHFIQYGGVRDWRALNDDAIYIEGRNGRWYEATFFGPCSGLRFADRVGFVADAGGTLDRFGSIVVRAPGFGLTECHFRTFKEVAEPPATAKRKSGHRDAEPRS